ncbi:MAG: DUF924 domain-containing protein [Devosiaceae bacterium]|nr:DUF924 domain-containing protein [Devosiaceae bacterium]
MQTASEILEFWFDEHSKEDWFGSSVEFDELLKKNFFDLHAKVAAGEASSWRDTPQGRVAEIIVLDQFSRQFFRGEARAFITDSMSLVLAQELVASGKDMSLTNNQRFFAYLPFMHSESLVIHETAVRLFRDLGDEETLKFEMAHLDVLKEFGRYPKRNAALGRTSTPQEAVYIEGRDGQHF